MRKDGQDSSGAEGAVNPQLWAPSTVEVASPPQVSPPTVWRSHKTPPKILPLLPRSVARPKSSKSQETQTMTHEKRLFNTEELVCQVMPGHSPGQSLEKSLMAPRVRACNGKGLGVEPCHCYSNPETSTQIPASHTTWAVAKGHFIPETGGHLLSHQLLN